MLPDTVIGRLMISCARQPGLAEVTESLVGFSNDEFYLKEWSQLVGKTFLDASFSFAKAVPIGVKPANPAEAAKQVRELNARRVRVSSEEALQLRKGLRHRPWVRDGASARASDAGDGAGAEAGAGAGAGASRGCDDDANEDEGGGGGGGGGSNDDDDDDEDDDDDASSAGAMPRPALGSLSCSDEELEPGVAVRRSSGLKAGGPRRRFASSSSKLEGVSEPPLVQLNPPDDFIIQAGDQILVIAEDDDSYDCCAEPGDAFACEEALRARRTVRQQHVIPEERVAEKLLFCGWRRDLDDMVASLDRLVAKGSELHLMSTLPVKTRLKLFREAQKLDVSKLSNLTIVHQVGNPVLRRHLERLALEDFSSILILADEAFQANKQTADSRSLASLLLIRDIVAKRSVGQPRSPRVLLHPKGQQGAFTFDGQEPELHRQPASAPSPDGPASPTSAGSPASPASSGAQRAGPEPPTQAGAKRGARVDSAGSTSPSARPPRVSRQASDCSEWCPGSHQVEARARETTVISEILDPRTKSLISVARVSDHIMSNVFVACILAMVAEQRAINAVLSELLSSSGAEIQLTSCLEYVKAGDHLDFYTIMARARKRSEVAIGFKAAISLDKAGRADPPEFVDFVINPRDKAQKRTWDARDSVIVIAHWTEV